MSGGEFGAVPDGAVPDGAVPDGAVPDGAGPEGAAGAGEGRAGAGAATQAQERLCRAYPIRGSTSAAAATLAQTSTASESRCARPRR
ncbi:MAG: hypothetical protein H0W67_08825 [Gemmatimonadales bacterium]|nr:hypothetical protein [Gemmatimonadales bacterium]